MAVKDDAQPEKKLSAREIGKKIIDASKRKYTENFRVINETFKIVFKPLDAETRAEIQKRSAAGGKPEDIFNIALCRGIEDEDGNPIWEEEDLKEIDGFTLNRLKSLSMFYHFSVGKEQ